MAFLPKCWSHRWHSLPSEGECAEMVPHRINLGSKCRQTKGSAPLSVQGVHWADQITVAGGSEGASKQSFWELVSSCCWTTFPIFPLVTLAGGDRGYSPIVSLGTLGWGRLNSTNSNKKPDMPPAFPSCPLLCTLQQIFHIKPQNFNLTGNQFNCFAV